MDGKKKHLGITFFPNKTHPFCRSAIRQSGCRPSHLTGVRRHQEIPISTQRTTVTRHYYIKHMSKSCLKVLQQLRCEAELDTFLLFYKVLVGFRPSELSSGHRVFIKLQVFPVY